MSVAISINIREIEREIDKITYKTANPYLFFEISRKIDRWAKVVREEWYSFSDSDREELKNIAYRLMEPPERPIALLQHIWMKVYMLYLILK